MKINRVTITGADDKVKISDLVILQNKYPFVEWGILFSMSKNGIPRYPTADWRLELMEKKSLKLSAHLCGGWPKHIMEMARLDILEGLFRTYQRVQLNYNFTHNYNWKFNPIQDYLTEHPEHHIIFQYNASNKTALTVTELQPNAQYLYDASGGRGYEIKTIGRPFNRYTGYSGGLNPDNLESAIQKIMTHKNQDTVWIDMETGVRTKDQWDAEKVNQVLSIADKYVTHE